MEKLGKSIGILSSLISICLWAIFIFFNPYGTTSTLSGETIAITYIMLLFPAIVAMIVALFNKPFYMLGAFIWSLPVSLYVMLTPSIFKLFGMTCLLYFVSFFLLFIHKRNNRIVQYH